MRSKVLTSLPKSWKYMQALKSSLLERQCERFNQQTAAILEDSRRSAYERYLEIFKKTQKDDKNVAKAFDDWRRSTIFLRIIEIYRQGLFTDAELQGFTQQTQGQIDFLWPKKKTA